VADWLAERTKARRTIHAALSYAAVLVRPVPLSDPVEYTETPITVRWHAKTERVGNISGGDYAEILSTIHRLLFNSEEMAEKGITLKHGDLIKLTGFGNYELELDALEPPDGPVKIVWTVIHP
jgi:hypothetical protein